MFPPFPPLPRSAVLFCSESEIGNWKQKNSLQRRVKSMSRNDSKYFSTTKKGEIPELKEELNSQYKVGSFPFPLPIFYSKFLSFLDLIHILFHPSRFDFASFCMAQIITHLNYVLNILSLIYE